MDGRTDSKRHVITVGLASAVALATLLVLFGVSGNLPSGGKHRVQALVPTAQDVYPGATVRMVGLEVGTVEGVDLRNGVAVLDLEIEDEYAPVRADDRVEVRLRTIAGENYVELYPGDRDADPLSDGEVLPLSQSVSAVEIDQLLSVLDHGTRERAGRLIEGLGEGTEQRAEQLAEFFDRTRGVVNEAAPVAEVLSDRKEEVAGIVDGLGKLMATVGERGAAIVQLSRQGRATAESIASQDEALRATLDRLPGALAQVRETTDLLERVSGTAAPVVSETAGIVTDLEPTIALLSPAAREGRRLVRELARTADPLRGVLRTARRASGPLAEALPELRSLLCETGPAVNYLRPYRSELTSWIALMASGVNFYDREAHAARVHALVGESSPVGFDPTEEALLDQLLRAGVLSPFRQLGWNPYPLPGEIEDRARGADAVGPGQSNIEYPRLEAMC